MLVIFHLVLDNMSILICTIWIMILEAIFMANYPDCIMMICILSWELLLTAFKNISTLMMFILFTFKIIYSVDTITFAMFDSYTSVVCINVLCMHMFFDVSSPWNV
jgi:hypothetical protein